MFAVNKVIMNMPNLPKSENKKNWEMPTVVEINKSEILGGPTTPSADVSTLTS